MLKSLIALNWFLAALELEELNTSVRINLLRGLHLKYLQKAIFNPIVDAIKLFFRKSRLPQNLEMVKTVCFDVWTCTKMWKQCYVQEKLYSKIVCYFLNGLFLMLKLTGTSRFSRFPLKKFYNISGLLMAGFEWQISGVYGNRFTICAATS